MSGALAAGAVGVPEASLLLYPVYFMLVNGAIAIFIHHRRRVLYTQLQPGVIRSSHAPHGLSAVRHLESWKMTPIAVR